MSAGLEMPVIRFNAHGCRYVVGKNTDGRVGLFTDNGESWIPFDEIDLDDCRCELGAEVGEVLYVSLYLDRSNGAISHCGRCGKPIEDVKELGSGVVSICSDCAPVLRPGMYKTKKGI